MMVVDVLMTSCQVSLKPKSGPLIAQTMTAASASRNAVGRPGEMRRGDAKRSK